MAAASSQQITLRLFRFLSLPPEVRNMIYEYYLAPRKWVAFDKIRSLPEYLQTDIQHIERLPDLMRTYKQLYREMRTQVHHELLGARRWKSGREPFERPS
ncbi:hypothetical protein B0T26DRAFT_725186 [Lasiosphaeria miniovina]|uniref:Uncharacterized protein n=1 Tax=Lasiosphaeria miniovina TaxID=1954250 RepID=A0AA39ZYH4_9PEZI|nr:uncharacterized protein B0T26DRAFT_725186 [Lasiosphaeria miniovina]KAK0706001.1 hypothetical protein B0T26DRAFT_725186 [Lasiosphaeria miniovina]